MPGEIVATTMPFVAEAVPEQPGSASLLTGRTILVTGAAGGIGSAVVRWCKAQGADLLLTDRPAVGLSELAYEIDAPYAPADIRNPDEIGEALQILMEARIPDGL